jgi:hypothetical protein
LSSDQDLVFELIAEMLNPLVEDTSDPEHPAASVTRRRMGTFGLIQAL